MQEDIAELKKLLDAGESASAVTADGDTALCAALRLDKLNFAKLLVAKGADVNASGKGGQPPIVLVSLRRWPQFLETLVKAGANPNTGFAMPVDQALLDTITDKALKRDLIKQKNVTPLMCCAARGDVESVAVLLDHGAKSNAFTQPSYRYALNFAADRGYLYVMRLLLGRKPESEPKILITVNLKTQRASVERDGKPLLGTKISTGRKGYETPSGRYVITNKYKNWISTIYKVPMPYFMRLNCGSIGLHSGYVTGRPASHGCIRLPSDIAKKLYGMVDVGDEVIIQR